MNKYILIMLFVFLTTACYAQISQEEKNKVLDIIKSEKNLSSRSDVESAIKNEAIDSELNRIINDIIERIRRDKVDKARKYNPTKKEILDKLQERLDSSSD